MKKQFAVIGLGRFGQSVAETLYKMGYDVLGIDRSEERVQKMTNCLTHIVTADATDEDALKALGIRNFDVVIVAIGEDIQSSILVTLNLKEMGVKYVVAKAQNSLHGKVLYKTGADKVVFPERDMGIRVARHLVAANIVDFIELTPDYSIAEITAPQEFEGKNLRQLDLRAKLGLNVLAAKRGKQINISPGAEYVIKAGDVLVVVGEDERIRQLSKDEL
ncbi:MAG: potassium channel family protein [bacterium]